MKKFILLFLAISLLFGTAVLAQDLGGSGLGNIAGKAGVSQVSLESRIGGIISSVLAMLGTLFLILTIYAGVLWMTASGDEGKIEKAKEIITAAVIGLAIVMSAYTITYFVGSKLGGSSGGVNQDEIGCCYYYDQNGNSTKQQTTESICNDTGETTIKTLWQTGECSND